MTDTTPATVAAMLDGVTPGPWKVEAEWNVGDADKSIMHGSVMIDDDAESYANARFIAYAREAVPALSAERDEYRTAWEADNAALADALLREEALSAKLAEVEQQIGGLLRVASDNHVALCRAEAAEVRNAALTAENERLRHLRDVVASGPLRGQLMEVWIENVMERAAALHDRPTEYEVKLSQLKEDFPNGV